jgi:YidC/Oxa1 family membrane protein insertase
MDRNQAIGLVLITVIMMLYFMYFGSQQQNTAKQKTDSVRTEEPVKKENVTASAPEVVNDSLLQQKFGGFSVAARGEAKPDSLSNKDIVVTFNSKGGKIEKVLLRNYLTDDKKPLYLIDASSSKMDLLVPTNTGNLNLYELYYNTIIKNDTSISFRADLGEGKYIQHTYTLPKEGFVMGYNLKLEGLAGEIRNEKTQFHWFAHLPKLEQDIELSRINSTVNYYLAEGEFDYLTERSTDEQIENLNQPVKWVAMKQRFFSSAIIADNPFTSGVVSSKVNLRDTLGIKDLEATMTLTTEDLKSGKGNFRFYFGPNHFQTLNKVTDGFGKNVFLGWPGISFINRFIVIPVFNFLEGFIDNYGIIIIILVILLKLILFPLSYKSYMSMAKMKVLKPEIDEIKSKHGDDMQKVQMETMELYRKVGINPLSGCIPVLLQMPILLAMFNFFPNSIELRQEPFLWAQDLSTYDAPILLPFKIPFYGSHVSLFTLLMTISTLVYTWFNNQISTVTGPMKTVGYIMPVVFMFVLNSFPSGLSFYYFMSNIVTIGQQVMIRRFVDEGRIRKVLEENKKRIASTPGKKSRWMSRLEEAMKAQEEAKAKKKRKK